MAATTTAITRATAKMIMMVSVDKPPDVGGGVPPLPLSTGTNTGWYAYWYPRPQSKVYGLFSGVRVNGYPPCPVFMSPEIIQWSKVHPLSAIAVIVSL